MTHALERASLIVVATGRFQSPIHDGHLEYIAAARRIARHNSAPFVILTGPRDTELLAHEGLTFAQRRTMLSEATDVPEDFILNQGGSPRGGRDAIARWASGFFEPLLALTVLQTLAVELVVVRKPDDIKDYGFGLACHYSDLLREFDCGVSLSIRDVTKDMTHLELSTRHLRAEAAARSGRATHG